MKEVFHIIPASNGPVVFYIILVAFLFTIIAVIGYFVYASRHVTYEVSADGLRIRGDLYGRTIPLTALTLERARAIDLTCEPDLQPKWRTNGAGLPGYGAGWFRLRNGEKALLFLTNRRHVAYLPTNLNYAVMLSVDEPENLIAALRNTSAGSGS